MSVLPLHAQETASRDAAAAAGEGLLDRISVGAALLEPGDWRITRENARFRAWFPPADGDTLQARVPAFDTLRAQERLQRGRRFHQDLEVPGSPRATALRLELAPLDDGLLLLEAHNITRLRETEYMIDSYARLMERQARELAHEKERVERLLLNIMPQQVADELRDFGTTTPQSFDAASVLLLDFVGFTDMAISRDPGPLIAELNDVFTSFDRIMEHCGAERIKTIGDAYMAVAGVPVPDPDHERRIARAALRMLRFLQRRNRSSANRWVCRIGIGSGPVIGSIVGIQKYVYDIFGPAVNLAARLEAAAEPMQVLVTDEIASRIRDDFVLRSVGVLELKGFGAQRVWSLEDEARKGR